jgi:hypothetical protein
MRTSGLSAEADNRHEVPREGDFNRPGYEKTAPLRPPHWRRLTPLSRHLSEAWYGDEGAERESGGPGGIRTLGLLNAIETRSQLRHGPTMELRGFEPLASSVRLKRSPS